jgi:photosystem II stability/assembly factor-like uncharacterized protein
VIPGAADLHGVAADPGAHLVLAVDAAGVVWSSADGGISFGREGGAGVSLDAVALSDDGSRAIAVGAHGTAISRLPGSAPVWTFLQTGTTADLHAALITDDATRDYIAGESGTLLTTTNQGSTWTIQPLGTSSALYGLEDL